jgi:hypothetical protein
MPDFEDFGREISKIWTKKLFPISPMGFVKLSMINISHREWELGNCPHRRTVQMFEARPLKLTFLDLL